jgi:hypothetical protein
MGGLLALPTVGASVCSSLQDFNCSFFQMACCFGSAACSMCCSICPTAKNSTMTRIMYALMLLIGTVVSCIMLIPAIQKWLEVCLKNNIKITIDID